MKEPRYLLNTGLGRSQSHSGRVLRRQNLLPLSGFESQTAQCVASCCIDCAVPKWKWSYLLTQWCRVLLEKLTGLQLVKKFPAFHGNAKVHYRTHKRPPPVSILGQPNPDHIHTSHLLEIRPNIIHPSTPRSPQWFLSLSLRFPPERPYTPPSPHPYAPHAQHTATSFLHIWFYSVLLRVGRDSSVGITARYGLGGPAIESRWGARFSAPVQSGPGSHPASYTMGTGSFRGGEGGKAAQGVTLTTPHPSSAEVKERVELYLYSALWAFVTCSRVNFICQLNWAILLCDVIPDGRTV